MIARLHPAPLQHDGCDADTTTGCRPDAGGRSFASSIPHGGAAEVDSMSHLFVSEGRCQFCHSTSRHVEHLVAGDSGLICNECVAACAALLAKGHEPTAADQRLDCFVFDRLTRHFAPMRPHEMLATSRRYPLRQQADLQAALDEEPASADSRQLRRHPATGPGRRGRLRQAAGPGTRHHGYCTRATRRYQI